MRETIRRLGRHAALVLGFIYLLGVVTSIALSLLLSVVVARTVYNDQQAAQKKAAIAECKALRGLDEASDKTTFILLPGATIENSYGTQLAIHIHQVYKHTGCDKILMSPEPFHPLKIKRVKRHGSGVLLPAKVSVEPPKGGSRELGNRHPQGRPNCFDISRTRSEKRESELRVCVRPAR